MNNMKNFVDEMAARKIIDTLCTQDFKTIQKLAEDSGIPVHHL